MTPVHQELLQEFQSYAQGASSAHALMEHTALHLHEKMTRYNWTGFYLVDPTDSSYLVVGPYSGSFTPNVRIPLDRGLCGAAASTGRVVVVQDVSKDARYLAGSSMVKSEIVAPFSRRRGSLASWTSKAISPIRSPRRNRSSSNPAPLSWPLIWRATNRGFRAD